MKRESKQKLMSLNIAMANPNKNMPKWKLTRPFTATGNWKPVVNKIEQNEGRDKKL